ncbi:hypothetical protein NIA73_16645 [Anaerobutyricum hallii]|nr:hypothetical protein [Anaerobutyricum hallii]
MKSICIIKITLTGQEVIENNIKDILRIEKDRRNMNLSRLFCFFRLRLLICIMLFLAFVTADKYVLTKEDTAPVFQKIEKNQSYKDLIKKYKLIGE